MGRKGKIQQNFAKLTPNTSLRDLVVISSERAHQDHYAEVQTISVVNGRAELLPPKVEKMNF